MSDEPTYILDTPVTDITGTDEAQKVQVKNAEGGTFTLTFDGDTTAPIAFDATAGAVEDALAALNNLEADEVAVAGTLAEGASVTFSGAWGDQDVPVLTADATALVEEDEKTAEVVITTTVAGAGTAVQRGTGDADRTGEVSPLSGSSPTADREANGASYGDA